MDLTKDSRKQQKTVDVGFKSQDKREVTPHRHSGVDADKVNPLELRQYFFQTVDAAPTEAPKSFTDQIKIYNNLLYVWDSTNETWLRFNYYVAP